MIQVYRPVKYRSVVGSLVVTPEVLTFSADEEDHEDMPSIVEEWGWGDIVKASANKAASKSDRLRVQLSNKDKEPLMFTFKDRETLNRVKSAIKKRLAEANASDPHSTSTKRHSEVMNDISQSERWDDSMNFSERWPEAP